MKPPTSSGSGNWPASQKTRTISSAFYAVEQGSRYVRRFKVYLRDGTVMSIPYATLPLMTYDPAGMITIKASELTIIIHGRGLGKLTDWFSEEKILWIKESPSGIDPEREEVFLSKIEVQEADDP